MLPQSYSAAEFDALAEKYASLNWRLVSKPDGATVKPDDFYVLYGRGPIFQTYQYGRHTSCRRKECCTWVGGPCCQGPPCNAVTRPFSRHGMFQSYGNLP